jgi:ATP phosphoribosyltransferase regulatory subunit
MGPSARLFGFIGNSATLRTLAAELPAKSMQKELDELLFLYDALDSLGSGQRIILDLSEAGAQPYYSGIAFQAYADGADSAVASGGRYDGLINAFCPKTMNPIPSVGFSIMMRKIEKQLTWDQHGQAQTPQNVNGKTMMERIKNAQALIAKGKTVVLGGAAC